MPEHDQQQWAGAELQREQPATRERLDRASEEVQRTYTQRQWEKAVAEWPQYQPALEQQLSELEAQLDALPGGPLPDIQRLLRLYRNAMDKLGEGNPDDVSHGTLFYAWSQTEQFFSTPEIQTASRQPPLGPILTHLRAFQHQFATTAAAPTMQAMRPSIAHMRLNVPLDRNVSGELSRSLRMIGMGLFGLWGVAALLSAAIRKEGKMKNIISSMIAFGGMYAMTQLRTDGPNSPTERLLQNASPYLEPSTQKILNDVGLANEANRQAMTTLAEHVWSSSDRKQLNRDLYDARNDPAQMAGTLGLEYERLTPEMQRVFQIPQRLTLLLSNFNRITGEDAREWVRQAIAEQVVTPKELPSRKELQEAQQSRP